MILIMRIDAFELHLDAPQPVYYAGQLITGKVHLVLRDELDFRVIQLKLNGTANVHWSESRGSGDNRRTVHYRNSEVYLDIHLNLCGTGEKTSLQAGVHDFPFSITLPVNLPSTFVGDFGRVVYVLSAKIDRPWKRDEHVRTYLTILSVYDLNLQPDALTPAGNKSSKTFGCMCCKTGPLNASLSLPKTGYVCGETIYFSAEIENLSNKVMTSSSISLIEHDVYYSVGGRQKHVSRVVLSHKQPQIAPGGSFTWANVGLQIPPLPPSALIHCNIIHIYYTVVLTVDPSGIGFDLDVPTNIVIGTIPLRQQYQHIAAAPNGAIPGGPGPSAPPPTEGGAALPPPPPPSYNEVIHGKTQMGGEEGEGGGANSSLAWLTKPFLPINRGPNIGYLVSTWHNGESQQLSCIYKVGHGFLVRVSELCRQNGDSCENKNYGSNLDQFLGNFSIIFCRKFENSFFIPAFISRSFMM
eukprot:sb/3464420/